MGRSNEPIERTRALKGGGRGNWGKEHLTGARGILAVEEKRGGAGGRRTGSRPQSKKLTSLRETGGKRKRDRTLS